MGDSYRPSESARRREDEYEYPERSRYHDYHDYDNEHRRRREDSGRSRSPLPDRLDYDEDDRRESLAEYRKYSGPDGGYGHGDGVGFRRVSHHSDQINRSGVLNYQKNYERRNRSPGRKRSPMRNLHYGMPERHPRYHPEMDFRHYGNSDYPYNAPNQGEKDVARDDKPSRILCVRGLKESTSEHLFAKGMEKLYAGFENDNTSGATPGSIQRVFRIRDKRTDQRMGHGFVEYHTADDAIAALKRAREMQKNNERLTISSQEFSISYALSTVFPTFDFDRVERNERYLFQGPEKQHKYIDIRYYPCELIVNDQSPHAKPSTEGAGDTGKKTKKSNRDTLENASKKRKAPGAVPAVIGYYQRKQAELHEDAEEAVISEPEQHATGVNAISTTDVDMPDAPAEITKFSDEQTYAYEGEDRVACYLCNSAFNTRDHVIRHVKESVMHAKYLLDSKLTDRALKRLEDKQIDPGSTIRLPIEPKATPVKEDAQPQYRDRAAERRQEEAKSGGGVQKVGFSLKGKSSKAAGSTSNRNSDSETEKGPSQPKFGKGMQMLQKAGWAEGQGLGAKGSEGIAAPIAQDLYTDRVGLGHEGGKRGDAVAEAERATKGNEFLEGTRDMARKRYEAMN